MVAHKIAPGVAEPGDIRPRYQQGGAAPLPAFLQSLSDSMAQRASTQAGGLQNRGQLQAPWGQNRNTTRTQAQNRAALVGVIIWIIFIVFSMLMTFFSR